MPRPLAGKVRASSRDRIPIRLCSRFRVLGLGLKGLLQKVPIRPFVLRVALV